MTETKPSGGRHASEACRRIAEEGKILQCLAGSTLHGMDIAATDDRDETGICIEPPQYVIGLDTVEGGPFEQYIYRTQPEGHRSGPGDLDLTVYSLRKWMKLATNGNPTILLTLFASFEHGHYTFMSSTGLKLLAQRELIVSRQAGMRFIGYMSQQRQLLDARGKGLDVTRPELIEAYGFDTKAAAHMVRLGWQGAELIQTGSLTLPMPQDRAGWLRELREGKHTLAEAQYEATQGVNAIREDMKTSPLREQPDMAAINEWLTDTYLWGWDEKGMFTWS